MTLRKRPRKITTGGFLMPIPGVIDPPIDVQRRRLKRALRARTRRRHDGARTTSGRAF